MENKNIMDVKFDIELLKKFLIKKDPIKLECNNYTNSGQGDRIYTFTNEDMKLYPKIDLSNKKVLCVTSSGDHILNSALQGAKNITGFDMNRFCKYFSAFKIATVKAYNFNKFKSTMLKIHDIERGIIPLSKNKIVIDGYSRLLFDTAKYLTEEELLFLNTFLEAMKYDEISRSDLFWDDSSYLKNNLYLEKQNFNILKHNIFNCEIKYVDCAIDMLNDFLPDSIYDVMYLSNILERVYRYTNYDINSVAGILRKILKKLSKKGVIYDYEFMPKNPSEEEQFEKLFKKKLKINRKKYGSDWNQVSEYKLK